MPPGNSARTRPWQSHSVSANCWQPQSAALAIRTGLELARRSCLPDTRTLRAVQACLRLRDEVAHDLGCGYEAADQVDALAGETDGGCGIALRQEESVVGKEG